MSLCDSYSEEGNRRPGVIQNFVTLASAFPEISLHYCEHHSWKWVIHVTLITPLWGVFCHPKATIWC